MALNDVLAGVLFAKYILLWVLEGLVAGSLASKTIDLRIITHSKRHIFIKRSAEGIVQGIVRNCLCRKIWSRLADQNHAVLLPWNTCSNNRHSASILACLKPTSIDKGIDAGHILLLSIFELDWRSASLRVRSRGCC